MGPGVAEMEFEERGADPIVVFAADKTSAGAINYPLFRMFANPMNTAGLLIDPHMLCGFKFEVVYTLENKAITLKGPEETYELLALIGTVGRYAISRIRRADHNLICAASSVSRLSLIAGKYVGKDDPVKITRAQHRLPAVGEILAPFKHTYFVQGWMRGSHLGPITPIKLKDSKFTLFDGPPNRSAGFPRGKWQNLQRRRRKPHDCRLVKRPSRRLGTPRSSERRRHAAPHGRIRIRTSMTLRNRIHVDDAGAGKIGKRFVPLQE